MEAIKWGGLYSEYFDISDPCFQRLARCGLICRSTVFEDTRAKTFDGADTPFSHLPVKERSTFGDASETGFVRFMEELRYKETELINWQRSIQENKTEDGRWDAANPPSRPVFVYDKVEAIQKAIKEGKMALQGFGTYQCYLYGNEDAKAY